MGRKKNMASKKKAEEDPECEENGNLRKKRKFDSFLLEMQTRPLTT
jgi:hypothetical protein